MNQCSKLENGDMRDTDF